PSEDDHDVAEFEVVAGSIGDLVWHDRNGDGNQDAGEPGLGGVLVTLTLADGTPVATINTQSDGSYIFTGLEPGVAYEVSVTSGIPAGYIPSALTTDPHEVTLTAGQVYQDADFGYQIPGIEIVKTADPLQVVENGESLFTMRVENTGDVDLIDVLVTDDQCSPVDFALEDDSAGDGDGFSNGDGDTTLAVGEVWTYECIMPIADATVINVASVAGKVVHDTTVEVTDDDTETVTVLQGEPSIELVKTVDPDSLPVISGDDVDFTLQVRNNGSVPLSQITIDDAQCDAISAPTDTNGNNDPILDTEEIWEYTCTVNDVTASFTNTASVEGTPPTGDPVTDTDDEPVTVTSLDENPAITITKSANPTEVTAGENSTFSIAVRNTGDVDLTNIQVTDDMCTNPVSYVNGDKGADGSDNADQIMQVGETWNYTCTMTDIQDDDDGDDDDQVDNEATANAESLLGTPADEVTAQATVTIITDVPAIHIVKTAVLDDTTDIATFTMVVTNTGNADLADVTVTDGLCDTDPADTLVYVEGDTGTDAGVGTGGDGILSANVDPAEAWTFTCTKADVTETLTNTATASGHDPVSGQDVTDTDSATVTVGETNPAFQVTKTAESPQIMSGGSSRFTMTVENTGDVALSDIVVDDPLCDNGSLLYTGGDDGNQLLDVGETWAYTCIITDITDDIENEVTVTGKDPDGADVPDPDTDHEATATVEVTENEPAIQIRKAAESDRVAAGEDAIFTLHVRNSGNEDLDKIDVTDPQCDDDPVYESGATSPVLKVGETWIYTCSISALTEDVTNIAYVTAVSMVSGEPVDDDDDATVRIRVPGGDDDDDDDDDECPDCVDTRADPLINIFDPAISKVGILEPGELGLTGETLTWVVTISNIGGAPGYDLVLTDTIQEELQILSADIDSGTIEISGQTVIFHIPVLQPGESISGTIETLVLESPHDGMFDNTVYLNGTEQSAALSADAAVPAVLELPATGYPPAPVEPDAAGLNVLLAVFMVGVMGSGGVVYTIRRRAAAVDR
ncbi:SdrD B-like domain-containing protein, partial [Chloroflexota bacterium]